MKTSQTIIFGLIALALVQAVFFYPQLPDLIATHFAGNGEPNGWSSKSMFFLVMIGIMVFIGLTLGRSVLWLWRPGLVNLPNRDYWLARERSEQTKQFVGDRMSYLGIATLIFLLFTTQLVIDANLSEAGSINPTIMWLVLALYFAYTAIWTLSFVRHFLRVPRS